MADGICVIGPQPPKKLGSQLLPVVVGYGAEVIAVVPG